MTDCPRCARLIAWLDSAVDRQHAAEELAEAIRQRAHEDRATHYRREAEHRLLNSVTSEILVWMYAIELENKIKELHAQFGIDPDPELLG